MGRLRQPDELVEAVIFLCSPMALFINSLVLPIDSGFAAYAVV